MRVTTKKPASWWVVVRGVSWSDLRRHIAIWADTLDVDGERNAKTKIMDDVVIIDSPHTSITRVRRADVGSETRNSTVEFLVCDAELTAERTVTEFIHDVAAH